jgi:hypothetical protein
MPDQRSYSARQVWPHRRSMASRSSSTGLPDGNPTSRNPTSRNPTRARGVCVHHVRMRRYGFQAFDLPPPGMPPICLDVMSLVASRCGDKRGQIAPRAAHERESVRNVRNSAINRTRSPSRTCGSITTGVHGCSPGGSPLTHHPALRDNPVLTHWRRHDTLPAACLVRRGPHGGHLFASSFWPRHTGGSLEALDRTVR